MGKASVKGNASSAKPRTEITVPPNNVRSAKASMGAKATSPSSPSPGNRNVASPGQLRWLVHDSYDSYDKYFLSLNIVNKLVRDNERQ